MAKSRMARTLSRQAKRGIPAAMYQLGLRYYAGRGIDQDQFRGAMLIRDAAAAGYKPAVAWMEDYSFDDDALVQGES